MSIRTAEKVLSILSYIQGKGEAAADELAKNLGMSVRNVLRYLNILREKNILEYDRKTKRYKIAGPDKKIGHVLNFKEKELLQALINFFEDSAPVLGNTIKGIRNKLGLNDENNSDLLKLKEHKPINIKDEVIAKIFSALEERKMLKIIYKSPQSGITQRRIQPLRIMYHDGIFYLIAYCFLRKSIRTFALDRVNSAEILDTTISDETTESNFSLPDFSKTWSIFIGKKTYKVRIKIYSEIADVVRRKPKWHETEIRDECDDGSLILTYEIYGLEEIRNWILQWIPHVEIIEPEELKNKIVNELEEALRVLKGQPTSYLTLKL